MREIKIRCKFFKKSITNGGDLSKQYFTVIDGKGKDSALVIRRYTLASSDKDKSYSHTGDELIKCFNGKRLWYNSFSIKLDTIGGALDFIHKLSQEDPK